MKSIILASIFLLDLSLCAAQKDLPTGNSKYFILGIGLPLYKVRDQAHSPLIYGGLGVQIRLGYEDINRSYAGRAILTYTISTIKPDAKPRPKRFLSEADLNNIQLSLACYKRVGDYIPGIPAYFVGGVLTLYIDTRAYNLPSNNILGFETNASLNAGGMIHDAISNNWSMEYETYFAFLTYGIRSNYIGTPIQGENFRLPKLSKWAQWAYFDKVFRWYNHFDADQQINDERQRQISYIWDFHYNNLSNPLKSTQTGFNYTSLFHM